MASVVLLGCGGGCGGAPVRETTRAPGGRAATSNPAATSDPAEPRVDPTPRTEEGPPSLPPGAIVDHGPGYLTRPAEIRIHGQPDPGTRVPLIVFLPPTNGTGELHFERSERSIPLESYVMLLPQGQPRSSDYLPEFRAFVDAYDARVMEDLERAKRDFPVDPDRIFASGFSLGGDLTWALVMRHPDVFRGGLVMGSRCGHRTPRGALETLRERDGRVVFAIGDRDIRVRVDGMARAHTRVVEGHVTTSLTRFPGGHTSPDEKVARALFTSLLD